MSFRSTLPLLAVVVIALLQLFNAVSADAGVPIGRAVREYVDESRSNWAGTGHRPLDATIWYPAVAGTPQAQRTVDIWQFGSSRLDAELAGGPPRPLVLISHGAGGTAAQLSWLAEQLVQDGFIVAGVNHHGNTAVEDTDYVHGFVLPTERAFDLSALLDKLLQDPLFGSRLDAGRIGAAGFSFGGFTVLAAGGITLDYEAWWDYCREQPADAMCTVPPEADFTLADVDELRRSDRQLHAALTRNQAPARDERIRAVFAIAPALLTQADLSTLDVPAAVLLAGQDDQVPLAETSAALAAAPNATVHVTDARHYSFLAPCTTLGRWFAGDVCRDPAGINRTDVHMEAASLIRDFFASELGSPD